MKSSWYHTLVATVLLWTASGVLSASADNSVILIGHPSSPSSALSLREVRAIFSMRMNSWPNGQPLQVYVLTQHHPVHEQFCKQILRIFPHQLQAGWDRLVFSGTGEAPKVVSSEEEMIQAVSNNPGAIGYLINQDKHYENIKTITVE